MYIITDTFYKVSVIVELENIIVAVVLSMARPTKMKHAF